MVLLSTLFILSFPLFPALASEDVRCPSTREFSRTLNFLRSSKDFVVTEKSARKIASEVSKGCAGASERFTEILSLLKKIGFSDPGALKEALKFIHLDSEVQKNFYEIFQTVYFADFFNFDFLVSYNLAIEFSKNFRGSAKNIRADFDSLAGFCMAKKNLNFPTKTCAQLAIEIARMSPLFPDGIHQPFLSIYEFLKNDEQFGISIKEAMQISLAVLNFGPQAPENFKKAFDYAQTPQGLEMGKKTALEFALDMAARSQPKRKL